MDCGGSKWAGFLGIGDSILNTAKPDLTSHIPTWAWYLWLLPLFIGLWLLTLMSNQGLFYVINQLGQSIPTPFWTFFDFLGNAFAVFGLTLFLINKAPRVFMAGVIGASISGVLGRLLKEIYQLPRPAGVLEQASFFLLGKPLTALSMPSGHTLTAFAIATAFFFSFSKKSRNLFGFLFLCAILTGLSRIVLGAHWPNDVFAGASLGLFGGVLGAWLANKIRARLLELNSWVVMLMLCGSVIGIYLLLFTEFDFPQNYPYQLITAVLEVMMLASILRKRFGYQAGN
jgi:membrane-associated phospholipid phosphatase